MKHCHDTPYIEMVNHIIEHGVDKPNRTGMDTLSVFGYQMRFNLRDGTIPLLTTKKMHTKSIIHELLWYLQGSDNVKYLQDNHVTIWDEWSSPEGHLRKVYGYQWRKWETQNWMSHVVEIPIRSDGVDAPFVPPINKILDPVASDGDEFIGNKYQTCYGDWFTVISKKPLHEDKGSKYVIQFSDTTTIMEVMLQLNLSVEKPDIDDPYRKSVYNQGCLGVYNEPTDIRDPAYDVWYGMMKSCYDLHSPEYQLCGEKGVFVDQSWRCFANFLRDIHGLSYFSKWSTNPLKYILSKDYFGCNSYGPTTCVFLPTEYDQYLPWLDGSKYLATNNKTGERREYTIHRWVDNGYNSSIYSTNEWTVEKINPRPGHLFRQQLYVDQIAQLIDTLTVNPNDRRLIVSAWNVADIPTMGLPPCHYTFQCYCTPLSEKERIHLLSKTHNVNDLFDSVRCVDPTMLYNVNGILDAYGIPQYELSLMLNQRSCDVGLGVPFNIAQYSILLRMIAEVVNMAPGDFIWSGGDVHIYKNHITALSNQVNRTPMDSPTFRFGRKITNIDDFKYEDFIFENYKPHSSIKMAVAV